ncbi:hypothetical protein KC19_1G114800 [Ceratodon purpureus]|uniref:Uncharacterized protein n=1 Tax=Ceratodon purpureus TaxID=3225 RepID=A0A8T0J627_CERPU|nr:hypothetical protein KC19_1G114800 [Ceratodon purpureus]
MEWNGPNGKSRPMAEVGCHKLVDCPERRGVRRCSQWEGGSLEGLGQWGGKEGRQGRNCRRQSGDGEWRTQSQTDELTENGKWRMRVRGFIVSLEVAGGWWLVGSVDTKTPRERAAVVTPLTLTLHLT